MARKVKWEVDPEAERLWPKRYPCQVTITLKGGREATSRVEWPKGDPENAVTDEEVRVKFMTLATPVLGEAGATRCYKAARGIASSVNLRELTGSLSPR